ncbi:VP4 precursor [Halorubrum pleomorphic virus 10]|uniref:VP4 n=1 Tax=Halorubrum pleomorphic virus 10 TaxID=2507576 RepID=A0A410N6S1_9VIRU|nr:VP4 precursor [Halorubrum pleomorphic virus 10]QAS68824.1 VP4 precursor [Halorubrum pleomorphic virus 10]
MDRDNASTATQADNGMTRRGVMRRGLIASGATLGVGYAGSRTGAIGGARAAVPIVGFAAVSLAYLAVAGAEKYLGDTRDYSGYTGGDALHAAIYEGALNMKSADERVMTSIENNISTSKNVALAKGKAALLTEMNNGSSEQTAKEEMNKAIDEYYTTIEKNIITHLEAQQRQFVHMADQAAAHSNLNEGDIFIARPKSDPDGYMKAPYSITSDPDYRNYTLVNGEKYVSENVRWNGGEKAGSTSRSAGGWLRLFSIPTSSADIDIPAPAVVYVTNPEDNTETAFLDYSRYENAITELEAARDEANAALNGFTGDVYAQYEPGDIPTEDIVDPITAATELEQNYGGDAGQSAYASMLGIPSSAEQAVTMTVHRPGGNVTIQADIYTEYKPPDTGKFVKETRYEPTTWDKPLYIAYEYTDSETGEEASDFVQLEDPFTIVSIEANGEEIDSFAPEARTTQTADISAIEEELAKIREEQIRLQEEAEEETSSGGGGAGAGFFSDFGGGASNLGIVALGGAVVALLLGNR